MNAPTQVCDPAPQQELSSDQEADIRTVLSRRSDLSTFVVHLTRDDNGNSAKEHLKSIVQSWKLEAKNPFGTAVKKLGEAGANTDSQKCVCFTETPLEYLYLLVGKIKGRRHDLAPYGVAITKKLARKKGVNPVWYVDITPGHDWLTKEVNELTDSAIASGDFARSPVAKIVPFIEQMGTGQGNNGDSYRKEFWWEREWRHLGDFDLPDHVILICPDKDGTHDEFEKLAKKLGHSAKCVDPYWGLEQIIARLGGFSQEDVKVL